MYWYAQILLNSEGEQPKSVKKLDNFRRKWRFLRFSLRWCLQGAVTLLTENLHA